MKFLSVILLIFVIAVAGCTQQSDAEKTTKESGSFVSEAYGFSFNYPKDWTEISKDLPTNWAVVKGTDTIIFTVNQAASDNLAELGLAQALRDAQTEGEELTPEKIAQVENMFEISQFGGIDWYTYGIEFPSKNVYTVISGTVCGDVEVTIVLVTDTGLYEINRAAYLSLLNSFSC